MSHEENIKKIDKMSHQDLIRSGHQYKDYLARHPKTSKILHSKSKALSKAKEGKKPFYTRANGSPETKKEYYARHWADLSKHENS